ncbi:MAG: tRNA (N(6)-L-threonylcarbamoyladenosine(37)-C(2))-methylthiotransferase MtaB [Bacillota bacterium]
MSSAVVFNLGCKVNQYECDTLVSGLKELGYTTHEELVPADIYIVNTCAVTNEAERKSRQIIARILKLNPNAYIMITGCASQKNRDFYVEKGINYVGGVAKKSDILAHIGSDYVEMSELSTKYEEQLNYADPVRTRAYVKVQDGCNNFCTYCIIPHLRGRSRSRSVQSAVQEIKHLAQFTKEIVITGINISHYGEDNGESLTMLINGIKDVDVRIRLGSVYVEGITQELLEALFSLQHFCPQFHLSLQHGDNAVLASMNRHYTAKEYKEKVDLIRSFDDNSAITTDIIVGFPTETAEAFQNTVDFVREVKFSDIHIFPYSKREGTKAYSMGQLDSEVVKNRKTALEEVRKELREQYLEKLYSVPQTVLFEETNREGMSCGYSEYYIRCYAENAEGVHLVAPSEIYKEGYKGELK